MNSAPSSPSPAPKGGADLFPVVRPPALNRAESPFGPAHRFPFSVPADLTRASWLPIITLNLWAGCVLVGILGFTLPYPTPAQPAPATPPMVAEALEIEFSTSVSAETPLTVPSDAVLRPPAAPPISALPEIPSFTPVATFESSNFPVPLETPIRWSEPQNTVPPPAAIAAAPVIETLTFGRGEGRQPAPQYPRQALRERQEGSVVVQFSVGENGRVMAAETVDPSPWPLLNEAAVRTVRQQWRFSPGSVRVYEVSIRFEMNR
jgi:TonB family protein